MGVAAKPLPDVSIESKARKTPRDNDCWYLDIQYTAVCNHGCGSYHTDDVRDVLQWSDEHENSDGHLLSKWERLGEGMQQLPIHADLKNRVQLIFAKMADQGASTLYKYSKPKFEGLEMSSDLGNPYPKGTMANPDDRIGGMEKHEH